MFIINAFFILITILIIEKVNCNGQSLRYCYQCSSNVDAFCIDSPSEKYNKLCPSNTEACRKIYQKLRLLEEDEIFVHRECALESTKSECQSGPTPKKIHQIVCECNTNSCNGILSKNKLSGKLLTLVFLILIIKILYSKY